MEKDIEKRRVCFVKEKPCVRVYKEALALRKTKKYYLILLCKEYNEKMFSGLFDEIIKFDSFFDHLPDFKFQLGSKELSSSRLKNILERRFGYGRKKLEKLVKKLDVDLFHAHIPPNTVPETVIKEAKKPVIIDAYDFWGISLGLDKVNKRERKAERYSLENASGICRKGTKAEIEYYRKYGYQINCPEFQWLDYCEKDSFAPEDTKKLSKEDGEIHLVYSGDISQDPDNTWKNYIHLGKILSKQGIHLHVYTIAKPGEFEEYERYAKNEKYFHFYTLMPYRDLIKEIARYDYALWVHPVYGKYGDEGATEEKLKVSIGNKLFTYLEAGLPIIISDHLDLGKKIVTNYKMGFSIKDSELNNLKEIIDGKEYPALKNNTLKAREYLSLDNQVKGLEEFYNLVLENQKLKD